VDIVDVTNHLTQNLSNSLEKVRIIFVWLGLHSNITRDKSENPPKAIMNMFHENKGSYAYIFTRMCR